MVFKRMVTNTLARAGVAINGDQPWDIQVLQNRFFRRAARGPLGLGESYMDRDWDVSSLDELFRRVISAGLDHAYLAQFNRLWLDLQARISNLQSRRRSDG